MKLVKRTVVALLLLTFLGVQLPSAALADQTTIGAMNVTLHSEIGTTVADATPADATPAPPPAANHAATTALLVAAGIALLVLLAVSAGHQCANNPALCSCNDNNNQDTSEARPAAIGMAFKIR